MTWILCRRRGNRVDGFPSIAHQMSMSKRVLDEVKRIIPPLSEALHKGQAGRVGVLGGSTE